jgi:hypothetical protein
MRQLVRLVPALAFATLAACGPGVNAGDDDDDVGPDARTDGGGGPDADEGAGECRKMDLIFVIDDSGSMGEEQTNLRSNFPMFAQLLNSYTISTGETLDYRAAITTTGITANITIQPPMIPGFPPFPPTPAPQTGLDGRFRQACGMTRSWLERTDRTWPPRSRAPPTSAPVARRSRCRCGPASSPRRSRPTPASSATTRSSAS